MGPSRLWRGVVDLERHMVNSMDNKQARIVRKFHAGLTASDKQQLREITSLAIRDAQGKLKAEASLQRCSGVDDVVRELQSEITMLSKVVKLFTAMAR